MIFLKNTKQNRMLQQACANVALSNMYPDADFLKELIKVANGEKTAEELIQDTVRKYRKEK